MAAKRNRVGKKGWHALDKFRGKANRVGLLTKPTKTTHDFMSFLNFGVKSLNRVAFW